MNNACVKKDESREQKILKNQGLVWHVVKRFENRGLAKEELFQIGCIGLIKAVDRFNASYQVQFSTYAVPLIIGELKRYFRDDGLIKVSRGLKENSWKINRCASEFFAEHGREATVEEISERTGLSAQDIALASDASREVESIYGREEEEEGYRERLAMKAGGSSVATFDAQETENGQEQVFNKILVQQLLDTLEDREREVLELRYLKEWKQTKVAEKLGMSQVQVSRMERKVLTKLQHLLIH